MAPRLGIIRDGCRRCDWQVADPSCRPQLQTPVADPSCRPQLPTPVANDAQARDVASSLLKPHTPSATYGLKDGLRLPHQPAALNQLQQWQAQEQEQEQQRVDADTAAAAAAAAAAGSAVTPAATTLAALLEDSAPPSMWTSSRSWLVKNNSNISDLVASKSSEPGGSGANFGF